MKTYKIHFIRHGLTEGNIRGQYVGRRTDSPLCPQGVQALIALRQRYDYPGVGKLYISPMTRCRQTAALLYPEMKNIAEVEQIAEMDFGDFEGKTIAQLQNDPAFRSFATGDDQVQIPGGESLADFARRCGEGLDLIISDMMRAGNTQAAVVTHGGVIMGLLAAYGYPKKNHVEWMADNGYGYTILITPQLWQSARAFEIIGIMPHGAEDARGALAAAKYMLEDDG